MFSADFISGSRDFTHLSYGVCRLRPRVHQVETGKNIELMTFVLTCCANIFVGCSVTPTLFRQITSFSDSFHYTKTHTKKLYMKSFYYFCYNIQIGPNCYMDTGVRDLEVAFFKAKILPDLRFQYTFRGVSCTSDIARTV